MTKLSNKFGQSIACLRNGICGLRRLQKFYAIASAFKVLGLFMQSPSDSVIVKSNANGLVRGMFTRLDIGCGINKMSGWVGMDRIDADGVDVVHDFMDFPWPFEDNSVAEARAEHVIEHIPMLCMCCRNEKEPF